ncbi:acyl-CoA dehydrogenase [Sphingomonas panacis]|uniref:Acyl-[acyl-carrier-protein] dehydrogenase MbtN n=1 Tax=Sphingomonas panacis TaxID=1560345 RepID=A0A1B3ZEL9_9SPHN|nr:acyl-CoA dehydrogenase family protein [Sphingomonas panacis]AOH85864.1 acyl-CoA dehydrogenase [Sphingomonas panacis]
MLDTRKRTGFDESHEQYRETVRKFIAREVEPYLDTWEADEITSKAFWRAAGNAGLLCTSMPEEYGGAGLDVSYDLIFQEELFYVNAPVGVSLQSLITAPYLLRYGSDELKARYLPGMVSGEIISALGMTEPGGGSDVKSLRTTARRDGDHYVVNGSKLYISNGLLCDLVFLAVRTGEEGAKGVSLLLVEADSPGFERGRNLDKIGLKGADTSELFFNDVRVPVSNLLGEEGQGFRYMMSELGQERLGLSIAAQAQAQRAFDEAVRFVKERKAFGTPVFQFQNTRFTLADMSARLQAGWAYLDWARLQLLQGTLTSEEAAASKLWHSETLWHIVDAALQLHGGAGYMNEYPIARLWRDARIHRIHGGTSEIMKEVISRKI